MASRSDTELLTEHFGYPPVSLLDLIINTTNTLADRALTSIESGLLGAPPSALGFRSRSPSHPPFSFPNNPAESHRNEVEEGVHKLETLLFAALDKNFDKFEIYTMRFLLTVNAVDEPYTTLSHYKGLDFGAEDGEGGLGAVGGVNELRRKLQESMKLRGMLEQERARNEGLLREMRRLVGGTGGGVKEEEGGNGGDKGGNDGEKAATFGFLREGRRGLEGVDRERPLGITARFGVSQLGSLRELSSGLRGLLPQLGEQNIEGGQEGRDWRRERLEYVEAATRRHLENVRGLELDKDGAVRDDVEMGGEGRGRGMEVGDLERVVGLLGVGETGKNGEKGKEGEGGGDRMDES